MTYHQLNETCPKIRQPRGLNVKLRAHQLTSVAAMAELEKQGSIIVDKLNETSGLYQTLIHRTDALINKFLFVAAYLKLPLP